jgi:two-component system nitrate/nitrite response regulator NarL
MDRQKENPDETAECIGLLRSLIPDGKVVLVAESNVPAKLALSSDACICNLSSRDILIKVLKLTLMDQWVFVGGKPAATASNSTALITSEKDNNVDATGSSPTGSHRRGTTYEAELSPRECDVLTCLAQGKSNKAIARIYNLSEATVKVHLKAILRKTKTHNRTQAAIWAITHCLQDRSTSILDDAGLLPAQQSRELNISSERPKWFGASRDDGLPPETTVSASSRL